MKMDELDQGVTVPIYEYTCKACKIKFEQLLKTMNSDSAVKCPQCGSKKTERAMSVFAVGADAAKGPSSHAHGGGCGCCSARKDGTCPMG